MLALLVDEAEFRTRLAEVVAWQEGYGRDYGCDMMGAFNDRRYREQVEARRAFSGRGDASAFPIWAHLGGGGREVPLDILISRDIVVPFRGIPDAERLEFAALAGFVWSIASEEEAQGWAGPVLAALGERKLILDLRYWPSGRMDKLPPELPGWADLVTP